MPNICEWNTINIRSFCDYFFKYNGIYMESVNLPNLGEIYKKCTQIIPLKFIDDDNYSEINANCLFVWEENNRNDLECEKINYKDLYEMLYADSVRRMQENIVADAYVQNIEEKNLNPELLIRYFDREHFTVCIVNQQGEFLYALCRNDMKKELSFSRIPKRRDLFVDDVADNTREAAKIFLKMSEVESIPILRKGKPIGSMLRQAPRKQILQWDWIDEQTIAKIWDKDVKLLVSSLANEIQGFVNRFSNFYQIDVFNEKNYCEYLSEKYKALVYSTHIWYKTATEICNIRQLYLDCLSNDMLGWFHKNHVEYYYFEMPRANEIHQFYKRKVNILPISGDNIEINGCYFQRDAQREGFHVYGGRRFTVGEPAAAKRTIYVYGPCIALGNFVNDADTIESQLQSDINDMNLNYRVVNCGGGDSPYAIGNDINSFYIMANTSFKPGDIVIHFGLCTWKNAKMKAAEHYFKCAEAFNAEDVLDAKCFSQYSSAHLNALGNNILERYILSKIKSSLIIKEIDDADSISYGKIRKQIDNDRLNQWLKEIERYKIDNQRSGCIVMNCNPFTKGHYSLVERSRLEVDYLYVFVVEEDKSFFSFSERYEMAVKNCAHWKNVKVIPGGRYIISGLTFEEYFNKDVLQEQMISPELDIQMFANYIAPVLGITVRFLGEEKDDLVTAQYNKALKELLPLEGIKVVEYPRYTVDGEMVSASKVRKCIVEKRWKILERYLTKESLQYILRK